MKGPEGFHMREKILGRIPIRLLKSLVPGAILYETKSPILILVQISGSSPILLPLAAAQRA